MSLNESRLEATNWILKKWNIDIASYQNKGASLLKAIAEEQKLLAYDLNANFDKLAVFNYPAILEISLPNTQGTKYLSLVSINGEEGIFGSVDRIEMPLKVIDLMWTHKALFYGKTLKVYRNVLEQALTVNRPSGCKKTFACLDSSKEGKHLLMAPTPNYQ